MLHAGNIVPGIAVFALLNITYYGNDYIEIGLSVDLASKANQATTYTITEVNARLSGSRTRLLSRILRNWIRLFWGFLCYAEET